MTERPTTDQEFEATFNTEKDRMEYAKLVRWSGEPRCPNCQHDKLWRDDRGRILERSACGPRL
jgi:hypothetical protein